MSATTTIAWCHHTFNPWWGCDEVSPACDHCYAREFSKRLGLHLWGATAERRFFGEAHWDEPRRWNRAAEKAGERRRVFCASMADVLEDRRDLDPEREMLWDVIRETPWLDWLLLTKRPERFGTVPGDVLGRVWAGTTVEDDERAVLRVPALLREAEAAAVRFLSCEPLLGPLDLARWLGHGGLESWPEGHPDSPDPTRPGGFTRPLPGIDWLIVGGESGRKRRELNLEWVAALHEQARFLDVPFFMKQDSGPKSGMRGRIPDEHWVREFPR